MSETECTVSLESESADVYDLARNYNALLANIQFILTDCEHAIYQNITNESLHTGFVGPVAFVLF